MQKSDVGLSAGQKKGADSNDIHVSLIPISIFLGSYISTRTGYKQNRGWKFKAVMILLF